MSTTRLGRQQRKLATSAQIFFKRLRSAIAQVEDDYDVVILETPPSLGSLTLGAIDAATGMIVMVHPDELDDASMSQFLPMMGDLAIVIRDVGGPFARIFSVT